MERHPLSKNLDNDLRVIARQAGLTKCEQLEKAVGKWVEVKKLKSVFNSRPMEPQMKVF